MELRVLQYFLAVAREESITKAAETLHMTQPPLSRQLKNLEEELGKQLLIRGAKRVTLTEDGLLLRERAQEMVELMEKTKAELGGSNERISGEIYLGSAETDAISSVAQVAAKLQKKYPLIRYHIYSGDAERVLERLDKGLLDFGLLVGNVGIEKYNALRLPAEDTWGILMRTDSPLAEKECVCPEDLWDQPLILSHQAAASREISAWLGTEETKRNIVLTYDLIYNASHFVKKGLGYALALDRIINTAGESELCFRPLSPPVKAGLTVVWKKGQVCSRASKVFLEELRRACSPLDADLPYETGIR